MIAINISPEFLSYLLAALTAVVFDWFPGVNAWYTALANGQKKSIMAATLAILIAIVFGLGCAGVLAGMSCDKNQVAALVQVYMIAIGINQGVHLLTKPASVLQG